LSKEWRLRKKFNDHPVVELGSSGYEHRDKHIGFVPTPVMKVVDWVSKLPQSLADFDPGLQPKAIEASAEAEGPDATEVLTEPEEAKTTVESKAQSVGKSTVKGGKGKGKGTA
jgi:hypothetical protein